MIIKNEEVGLKIVCVGVGGAGGNVVQSMFDKTSKDINLIALDTDKKVLKHISKIKTMQIGSELLKGSSADNNPKLGEKAAIENQKEIRNIFKDADMVFIVSGLGGGTGTGATPVIAKIAKETGALTISISTIPFEFEGKTKLELAKKGLEKIIQESDSVILSQNEVILPLMNKKIISFKDSFKLVDNTIKEAVNQIASVVLSNREDNINLDLDDLKTVMGNKKMASVGIGEYKGENAAYEAIKQALKYKLLGNIPFSKATGILIHFNIHPDFPILELCNAMEIFDQDTDAITIFGTTMDNSLTKEHVKVSLILAI